MYAIIGTGGKQYRVMKGDLVKIELLPNETKNVTFSEVYLVGNGRDTVVGNPVVQGATVTGTVTGTGRLPKILVFKMKRRKQYKRTIGHRQYFTSVRIDDIDSGGTVEPLQGAAVTGRTRKVASKKASAKKKAAPKKQGAAPKKSPAKKAAAGTKKTTTKRPAGGKKTPTRKAGTKRTTKKKTASKETTTKKKT